MSTTIDAQGAFWEDYQGWCRENGVEPTYDGFSIWLDESDLEPADFSHAGCSGGECGQC